MKASHLASCLKSDRLTLRKYLLVPASLRSASGPMTPTWTSSRIPNCRHVLLPHPLPRHKITLLHQPAMAVSVPISFSTQLTLKTGMSDQRRQLLITPPLTGHSRPRRQLAEVPSSPSEESIRRRESTRSLRLQNFDGSLASCPWLSTLSQLTLLLG